MVAKVVIAVTIFVNGGYAFAQRDPSEYTSWSGSRPYEKPQEPRESPLFKQICEANGGQYQLGNCQLSQENDSLAQALAQFCAGPIFQQLMPGSVEYSCN
jgi:hypothetical protein